MSQDGETNVGAARLPLAPLDGLDDLPVHDHVTRFEAVHEALAGRLDGSDDTSAGGTEA
jgi:hypothetical protein